MVAMIHGIKGRRISLNIRRCCGDGRAMVAAYIMGLPVSGVMMLILDFDRPGAGFVAVTQEPMTDSECITTFSNQTCFRPSGRIMR